MQRDHMGELEHVPMLANHGLKLSTICRTLTSAARTSCIFWAELQHGTWTAGWVFTTQDGVDTP